MRPLLAVLGVAIFVAVAAFGGARSKAVVATPAPTPSPTPFEYVAYTLPTAPPRGAVDETGPLPSHHRPVTGFGVPVAGAALPTDPDLWPNALRDYRAGYHEGIDFPAKLGTPVLAAAAGTIARIDRDFTDWTAEQRTAAFAEALALGYTPESTLDRIRGRQVWIDHGGGIVTRYAHLSNVAALAPGAGVEEGAMIGNVGSSGYPEGGAHLHFEIRVGEDFLGDGLTGEALARVVAAAFR